MKSNKKKLPYKLLFNTENKRRKFIKKGNIITFKKPFYPRGTSNQGYRQIIVLGLGRDRGAVKIIGSDCDSSWYANMEALMKAIDWDWMEDNIISERRWPSKK